VLDFNPTLGLFWHQNQENNWRNSAKFQSYLSLILTLPQKGAVITMSYFQSYFSLILTPHKAKHGFVTMLFQSYFSLILTFCTTTPKELTYSFQSYFSLILTVLGHSGHQFEPHGISILL